MLVLSRERNQSIVIGDDVEIVVVDIHGDKVRLGVMAPRDLPVHRREVYDAIRQEVPEGTPALRRSDRADNQGVPVEESDSNARHLDGDHGGYPDEPMNRTN